MTRWRIERVRPLGVLGVSVWDFPTDGGFLWQRVGAGAAAALRAQGCSEEEVGRALAQAVGSVLAPLAQRFSCDAVHMSGGLTEIAGFRAAFADGSGVPVSFARGGLWSGEVGGRGLLADRGFADGAVLDVGQTSIKGSARSQRLLRPRDLDLLPPRYIQADGTSRGAPTEPAAAFIGGALADLLRAARPADPCAVVALPCPLDASCVPGPCTYGWEGDRRLLPEICNHVDRDLAPWPDREPLVLVLNDAELAAETARRDLRPAPGAAILCLTLGFGPGGAALRTPAAY